MEESSASTSTADTPRLCASKEAFPQEKLFITEYKAVTERLEKLGLAPEELDEVLLATERLLWKAQDFLMVLGLACKLVRWKLSEKELIQPVVKAFFVVLTRNILKFCHIAVWIPTKQTTAVIDWKQVSAIPDLVIACTEEIFSIKEQLNYSHTLFNLEVEKTKNDTIWALRTKLSGRW